MRRDTNLLAGLRRERGPLATLAVAAVLARVLLSALGIVAMPASAGATQIVCTNTGFATAPLHGVPARFSDCPCGNVCPHAGGAATDLGRPAPSLSAPVAILADGLHLPKDTRAHSGWPTLGFSIRAPPLG